MRVPDTAGETSRLNLDTPLEDTGLLPRLDRKAREGFEKLGLRTVGDALAHFPRRHEDRSRFDGFPAHALPAPVCLLVEVADCSRRFARGRGRSWFEAAVQPVGGDALGGRIALRWFNLPYIHRIVAAGQRLVLHGQPRESGKRLVIDHPEFEIVEEGADAPEVHLGRIVPVYPLAAGVSQKPLRALLHGLLERIPDEALPDWLPAGAAGDGAAGSRAGALRQIHYPDSFASLEAARRYLALEEFVRLQHALLARRAAHRSRGGCSHRAPGRLLSDFLERLPFEPTGAQRRCIEEIRRDLADAAPMARLLQGDVGSGKTLVAAAAVLHVLEAGRDAALMAPTQILAEQHFLTFRDWFEPLGIEVALKTSSRDEGGALPLFAASRDGARRGGLTVGTHALVHGRGEFGNGLGLAVIDEQHKFGVTQREALAGRGEAPDVLVMTATPIPRTLSLAFYGDLDVSVLDETPPGRGRVVTGIRLTSQTEDAAAFLRAQLEQGQRAYIVYPLVEESDKVAAAAATAELEAWRGRLPGRSVGLMHGRMAPEEKQAAMESFRAGRTEVLVTTTVIEVGVDVPEATVMLVYHAERFGLAQLHQLRGRVGRGAAKSYCVLMVDPEQEEARERLAVLAETRDGFRIAEEDLRRRGPGEVLGTQQSGLPALNFVEFLGDTALVQRAREIAAAMTG